MPPHIAQLVAGHRDINTTMGYKAVYPEEAINGHRAFIARRRALRPAEEYRTPTDDEWQEFLGHFEHRKVSLGTCGRSYATACIHEHSCLRCPLLRPDPAQRHRLVDVRDNLIARIDEARREGWLGEVEGLQISLAGARTKLAQLDQMTIPSSAKPVDLGISHPPTPLKINKVQRTRAGLGTTRCGRSSTTAPTGPGSRCGAAAARATPARTPPPTTSPSSGRRCGSCPAYRAGRRPGRKVLIRVDGAGATHELLDWLASQRLSYSVGFGLTRPLVDQLAALPATSGSPPTTPTASPVPAPGSSRPPA